MRTLRMVIGYKDGEFLEAEANTIEELIEIYNHGCVGLWGKSARPLKVMTLDEADKFVGQSPRGNR